jgi:hypothetical protein
MNDKMGSYYQPMPYMKTRRTKGGFVPSLMGGVLSNGPLLLTPAIAQGYRLLQNNTERMKSRKGNRKRSTRKTRRTNRKSKNTRKA